MNPLSWLGLGWVKLALIGAAIAALVGLYQWRVNVERATGRAQTQLLWDASVSQQRAAALEESQGNANETLRRVNAQQENDRAQSIQLAAARADADRNARDADSLRTQSAAAARQWSDALNHSPTGHQCQAAGAAIVVQADLLGRVDRVAGDLAEAFDTARAHGLKCQADYDALTPRAPITPATKGASDGHTQTN